MLCITEELAVRLSAGWNVFGSDLGWLKPAVSVMESAELLGRTG